MLTMKPPSSSDLSAAFLKHISQPFMAVVYACVVLDIIMTLLFIAQAYALAYFIEGLIYGASFVDWRWFLLLATALLLRPAILYIKSRWLLHSSLKLSAQIRQHMLTKLGEYGNERGRFGQDGAVAMKVLDEPDNLKDFLAFRAGVFAGVIVPIMIASVVAMINQTVALMLLVSLPLFVLAMMVIGINTAKKSRQQMDALSQMGGRFLDWLRGVETLKRLNAHAFVSQDIKKSATDYQKRTISVLKIAFLNTAVLELLASAMLAIVACFLALQIFQNLDVSALEVGQTGQGQFFGAVFILLLVAEFFVPLRRLGALYHGKSQAMAAAAFLGQFLQFDDKSAAVDSPDDLALIDVSLQDNCCIQFCQVGVKDNGRVRLSDANFVLNSQQKLAIMGKSGVGKSTILHTLLQFCRYTGSITINGIELRQINPKSLRKQIAYLPQTPSLLPLSILDNLRLVRDIDEPKANELLQSVGLDVSLLPKGVHTMLQERGVGLSGGQAQKVAIAQLLLQDCPLWLIDEPTEHLDDNTKRDVMALIDRLTTHKTVIWVTHDKPASWIDQVITLGDDGGRDEK